MVKMTRAKAISAMCKWCTYDSKEKGTWTQQVSVCQATECPLYSYRPIASSLPAKLVKWYRLTYDDLDSRAQVVYIQAHDAQN